MEEKLISSVETNLKLNNEGVFVVKCQQSQIPCCSATANSTPQTLNFSEKGIVASRAFSPADPSRARRPDVTQTPRRTSLVKVWMESE